MEQLTLFGIVIRKSVRACHIGSASGALPPWLLQVCSRCAFLTLAFNICLIGLCNPGFRRFVYLVLVLPLGHLGMTVGSYVLYLHCDCVDRQEFSLLLIWILWCVWPWLLAIEAV